MKVVKKKLKQFLFPTALIIFTLGFNTCLSFGETIAPTLLENPSSQVSFDNINKVILEIGNSKMSVFKLSEKTPEFKAIDNSPEVVPLIKNGRTLLPLRSIVETFGGTVFWNSDDKCSQININNKELLFYPGKRNFKINGKEKELLVAPEIVNGRTYLPLRDFSENTGFVVNWKPADKQNPTSQVEIIKPFTGLFPASISDDDGEKWGFIDSTGAFIIKPQFKEVSEFNLYGIAAVRTDEGISIIDSKGYILIKPIQTNNLYDEVYYNLANGYNFIIKGSDNINYAYSPEGTLLLGTKMNIESIHDKLISYKDFVEDKYLYGLIDFKGHIVVSANYAYVGSVGNGVYYGNSGYEVENTKTYFNEQGDIIPAPNSNTDSHRVYSDGLASFLDSKTMLYGYTNGSGEMVITPKFTTADKFIDGFAYATIPTGQNSEKNVIIDKKGKVVFEYDGYEYLTNLGNGLFIRGSNKIILIDAKTGKTFLSTILNFTKLDDNILCVSEMNKTYFIDSNMNKIDTLPTFEGIGDVWMKGEILKVSTNKVTGYFKKDGSPVWTHPETILNLGNGVKFHYKLRNDGKNGWYYSYPDYTPFIEGLSDKKVEEKINSKLKEKFSTGKLVNNSEVEGEEYWENIDVAIANGTPIMNNDLLVVAKDTYIYTGGAHGFGLTDCANINLKTGELFTLDDLLKENSGFEKFVVGYLSKQSGFEEGMFSFEGFDKTYSFKLSKDCLELVFPNFNYSYNIFYKIPYSKIMSYIDTDSVLWNSFEKDTNSIFVEDGINQEEVTNLIAEYEKKFIEAVNSNNFNVLKNVLIPNSSLYKSQKALIPELNKKGIKEKLNKFKVEEIVLDLDGNIVVTVSENIGISTNGGEYKDKDFLWSYKIARNKDGDLQMFYIENASQ